MVRKSILVYELLRSEQPEDGFSEKEIVEHICNKHDITPGKGLRRQVAVALRRGLDFGIIAKKNNKFKFDPDNAKILTARRTSKKGKKKRKTSKRATRRKTSDKAKNKNDKPNRQMPPAGVPKSWIPTRRNLTEEPLSKVKKV
ncbi:uncharacterized protein LOC143265763 [Megachile rotundata]|uniref:uncharacterized protein LOC143265763 n=1 Tax=Megachile rotundata TaxID=143995 RepID=UPI003FCF0312